MSDIRYIQPSQRVVHQGAFKVLLLAQFVTVCPFLFYMPLWLLFVFLLVVLWRWRVLRGQLKKPPLVIVLFAISIGVGGLVLSGLNQYSLDTAVALCILGYQLKSLEVLRRRDAIFQVYLGIFLTGVYLLYRFDPIGGLIMLLLLFVNVFALQTITADAFFNWRYATKQSSVLIFSAIPVMIAGFLFFPRLPPLWTIPNDQRGAVTGMSDELRPGAVANLAQSNNPAFRVSFESDMPPRSQWYWRGNTMEEFDGETWRSKYKSTNMFQWPYQSQLPTAQGDDQYRYTVIMENSGQHWMYFLDWPTQIVAEDSRIMPDARAATDKPITSVFRYQATSSQRVGWVDQQRHLNSSVMLPAQGNEGLRQWAVERRMQYETDMDFINSLLAYIRTQDFYYTLRPPQYLGSQSIENFWLGDRRGFCEHYASATAFILRSVGIPARIVGGYLGGTYVSSGNYIQVRQMEAHAWVEAWLDGTWQRIDPTAAVAPNRIEMNVDDLFLASQPSELSFTTRVGKLGVFNRLSMMWDSVNYQWQVAVLNYNTDKAMSWFEAGFGRVSAMKLAIAFLCLIGAVALALAVSLGMIRMPVRRSEPYNTIFQLERIFGKRLPGETINQYINRLCIDHPNKEGKLKQLQSLFERALYESEKHVDRAEMRTLLRNLRQIKAR